MNTPLAVTELLSKAEAAGLTVEHGPATALVRDTDGSTVVEFVWLPTVAYLRGERAALGHVARALDAYQVEDKLHGRQSGDVLVRIDDGKDYEVLGVVADPLFKRTVNYVVRRYQVEGAKVQTLDPGEFHRN